MIDMNQHIRILLLCYDIQLYYFEMASSATCSKLIA